jgi:hypothetical protein
VKQDNDNRSDSQQSELFIAGLQVLAVVLAIMFAGVFLS